MTENLKKTIEQELALLPNELRTIIGSFDWVKISEEIGKKHLLSVDDINVMQAEVGIILMGIEEQELLAQNIETNVGISKDEAEKITKELVDQIFRPLGENLKKSIKMSMKTRTIHWQQNIDFILTGGNYTAFLKTPKPETKKAVVDKGISTPFNQSKLDDLKSQFTI